jgi:hypothetical protein
MFALPRGAVAQLGEHLTGSQGVRGSSPLSSTKKEKRKRRVSESASRRFFVPLRAFSRGVQNGVQEKGPLGKAEKMARRPPGAPGFRKRNPLRRRQLAQVGRSSPGPWDRSDPGHAVGAQPCGGFHGLVTRAASVTATGFRASIPLKPPAPARPGRNDGVLDHGMGPGILGQKEGRHPVQGPARWWEAPRISAGW